MIITNEAGIIRYPARPRRIIVKYTVRVDKSQFTEYNLS